MALPGRQSRDPDDISNLCIQITQELYNSIFNLCELLHCLVSQPGVVWSKFGHHWACGCGVPSQRARRAWRARTTAAFMPRPEQTFLLHRYQGSTGNLCSQCWSFRNTRRFRITCNIPIFHLFRVGSSVYFIINMQFIIIAMDSLCYRLSRWRLWSQGQESQCWLPCQCCYHLAAGLSKTRASSMSQGPCKLLQVNNSIASPVCSNCKNAWTVIIHTYGCGNTAHTDAIFTRICLCPTIKLYGFDITIKSLT